MTRISVLGTGAMGSRMAANLIKAGHAVTVWNRTPEAAASLVSAGARQARTPQEAAAGAEFVMSMVRDDDASREVWLAPGTGALAGMAAGSVIIESSTVTPDWIRELGKHAARQQVALLEAPVSGSLPQAEAAQLIYLAGGEASTLQRCEPVLKAMASAIQHVGPLGTGALVKLATNTLLGVQLTALAELIGMLRRAGADAEQALKAVAATPAWSPVAQRLSGSMLSGNFAPQFPVALIEKDFGYTMRIAGAREAAPTIAAARDVFREAIKRGLGDANMTAVAKLYSPDVPADKG
ncbi:NAD(P)-dependent oxidoreductase [Noviherbaspirillum galbum]|uniref:NAD(P)-dependent oxidoreductase n=1 Tax=Noviherbaspirillum galbum TaxID=2709383 RepID=A0A6B3SKE6_9BURK|nr:NAD(P)-dependent oxidoreductase [Noviherbaspirillum galbum]NEX61028.1 NAD(P)-dependent oxidoreductase [Noviherbaspirillum galbum]